MSEPRPREQTLFSAALELPSETRAAYLDQHATDPVLRQRVEALLRSYEAGQFLEQAAEPVRRQITALSAPVTERAGDSIGGYKLLQQIGEGGCGVVYMAEQERPVRRRVALKIIKLGMDTKAVIARFEAERQALAMMDHPNIAKVFDAGATETGRPYFVMELVRGMKITEYCDEARLPIRARLDLFIQVCYAIQHAHQKGIIHRDIKPSNILVSLNDGVAVPKVIDFGIAKATSGQRFTDKTLFTAFEQFIGTPAYMSPEQAVLTSLDIDTRSDIYALGVLLYEMLTGRTPFETKELLAVGLDEMRRTIREREPERPSTCLSTLGGNELSTAAQRRGIDSPKLVGELRGDLDWIAMKCLEKDRARRYGTATDLAQDIQRHLQNEPVVACPPSRMYRFRKLVRRRRFAFTAAGAIAAALMIGLGIATWMFIEQRATLRRALAAEKKAQTEAVKSQQVATFLQEMLKAVGPEVALGRDTTLLKQVLDTAAERLDAELKQQPEVEAQLRAQLAAVYQSLSQFEPAEAMARRALALYRQQFGNIHTNVADAAAILGDVLSTETKPAEAEAAYGEALRVRRSLRGDSDWTTAVTVANLAGALLGEGKLADAETQARKAVATLARAVGTNDQRFADAEGVLGRILTERDKLPEAEALSRQVLAIRLKASQEYPLEVANALCNLGNVLLYEKKNEEAEASFREALEVRRKLLPKDHDAIANALNSLAAAVGGEGKFAEAEATYLEALGMWQRIFGKEHPSVASCLNNLGMLLQAEGRFAAAEERYAEAMESAGKREGPDHPHVAFSLINLASVQLSQEKYVDAEISARRALAIARKALGAEHDASRGALKSLGVALSGQRKWQEAEEVFRELIPLQRKALGEDHPAVASCLYDLAEALEFHGKWPEAENAARECLSLYEQRLPNAWETANTRSLLGVTLFHEKKFAEAEPVLLAACEGFAQQQGRVPENQKWRHRITLVRLMMLYKVTGQSAEAEAWRQQLEAMPPDQPTAGAPGNP